ncbi:MAG: rubredoxin-like domain-containing protein [Candidatus Heimdallarchaeaceae archaeon]
MTKYICCKVCGYITTEGEIKDYCPTCGAKAKAFEPYELTISEKRKIIFIKLSFISLNHMYQRFYYY